MGADPRPVLVITGPTATGKTALAIEVARRIGGEIISLDSRQIYRTMDIGTAKPSRAQRAAIAHHGIDIVDPADRYSAGKFANHARGWIHEISARGSAPILAGGTGFFLKALTEPMFTEQELPPVREELRALLNEMPLDQLMRWVHALDPAAGARLERQGGRQRIARVLEVVLLTGRTLSWWHQHAAPRLPAVSTTVFVLDLPRSELYQRINRRVEQMVADGLVEEVRALAGLGLDPSTPALNATGYAEVLPYLRGEQDLPSAVDAIQRATRRYARRQLTWFKHQLPPQARWLDATRPCAVLADEIVAHWEGEVLSANRD